MTVEDSECSIPRPVALASLLVILAVLLAVGASGCMPYTWRG